VEVALYLFFYLMFIALQGEQILVLHALTNWLLNILALQNFIGEIE